MSAAQHHTHTGQRAVRQPAAGTEDTQDIPAAPGAAESSGIAVLSTDEALDAAIRAAVAAGRVLSARTLPECEQLLRTRHCGVVITDQASSRTQFVQIKDQLRKHQPALVLVGVGNRGEDNALIQLLSAGVVDRLMIKPVTPALSKIVIESAQREYRSRCGAKTQGVSESGIAGPGVEHAVTLPVRVKPSQSPHADTPRPQAAIEPEPRIEAPLRLAIAQDSAPPPRLDKSSWLALLAVGVIVAGLVWGVLSKDARDTDHQQMVSAHLLAAQNAMQRGQMIEPPKQSALDHYNAVLGIDPANMQARRGVEDIMSRLLAETERQIAAAKFAAALVTLQNARRIWPADKRLAPLDAQLRTELQKQLTSTAQAIESRAQGSPRASISGAIPIEQPKVDRGATLPREPLQRAAPAPAALPSVARENPTDVEPSLRAEPIQRTASVQEPTVPSNTAVRGFSSEELLQLVLLRVSQNRLFEPAQDSANEYLGRIRQKDPGFSGLERGIAAVGQRLVANAQLATQDKNFDAADRALIQARALGYRDASLDTVQSTLQAARSAALRPSAPPMSTQPATPPLAASAPAAWKPNLVRMVEPEYPAEARVRDLEGWVDLSFVVSASGDVVDVRIEDGNKRQLFGRPAMTAVKQWKYQPRPADTVVSTERTRVRLQFRSPD